MSVALLSPFPLGSTMATWAGLMKTSLSPSWRLNCTRGGTSGGCGGTRGSRRRRHSLTTSACRWRDRREAAFPVVTDVAPARLRPTLDAARAKRVATVVLDTPPRSETAALEAARAADLVIVPCRPQIVDLETVPTTIQVLALARDPLAVAVLVAAPPRGQRADQARRAIQGLGLRVCPHTLGHRTAWGDASALGLTVGEYQPAGRAAVELRRVVEWLTLLAAQPQLPETSDVEIRT